MTYLLRVFLPDQPGSLGRLANAFGEVEADIRSVDVVTHSHAAGVVVDDIVVELPPSHLPDTLITAAQSINGVQIDSIRPFSGSVNRSGQVALLSEIATARTKHEALTKLVDGLPLTMSAGWALVLGGEPGHINRLAASVAAPEDNGEELPEPPVTTARALDAELDDWLPEHWTVLDSSLAATPISEDNWVLVIGRPGGPDFLAGEVEHLGRFGHIVTSILRGLPSH